MPKCLHASAVLGQCVDSGEWVSDPDLKPLIPQELPEGGWWQWQCLDCGATGKKVQGYQTALACLQAETASKH